ncbi:hypothetical protein N7478_003342 [Penicillium angulare]|uniref:uncharacterized protein n=1 Tax=Penicillium angulare TaxID=116970 RepID=UPI002540D4B1|nr:uncharacterized protein N7478_003342 [Penicillium angulare]KAJ5287656.1 hypothetical protein N7478_003342 [Penicillium angulare]
MPPSYILVIYSKLHDAKQNTYQYKLANYPGLEIDDASPLLQKTNEVLQPDHYRAIGKDISNLFTGQYVSIPRISSIHTTLVV